MRAGAGDCRMRSSYRVKASGAVQPVRHTEGVLAIVDDIAARLKPDDPVSARGKTLSLFAMLIGTLQLSRALANRRLANEILDQGIQSALALLADD